MFIGKKIAANEKRILLLIIGGTLLLRIVNINYGLPLWLIPDEPPFILAALKMIELKTMIPGLYLEEFNKILYFPPYLSYIYLLPFSIFLFVKYLFFEGSLATFTQYLISDLSPFFIIARIISLGASLITIFLIYKIGKNIFANFQPALFAAAFLGFSLLPTSLAFVARDWTMAVMFFALVFYFLTKPDWPKKKKLILASLASGIAFGISYIAGFFMLFVFLWHLFFGKQSLFEFLKDRAVYQIFFLFSSLAVLAFLIYPFGFFLSNDNSLNEPKTIFGLLKFFYNFLKPILFYEPTLFIFFGIGLIYSFIYFRKYFLTILVFFILYLGIFYIMFHHKDRFSLPLYPLLALTAGYGLARLNQHLKRFKKINYILILGLFAFMITGVIKLDWLALRNDTRSQARNFIEANLPNQSKILVLAPLTRLFSNNEAVEEKELIQPSSLRQRDLVEKSLPPHLRKYPTFHALNLDGIGNKDFFANINKYVKEKGYEYLLLSEENSLSSDQYEALVNIPNLTVLKTFPGTPINVLDISGPIFNNLITLFEAENSGPTITLYQIH